MKVLNLYAGIGGNRALWPEEAEVTSVELDPQIAEAYSELWPNDTIIVKDAHRFLLEHLFDGWDFIWSSPPCQTHSKLNRFHFAVGNIRYPDLDQLYGEIILLSELIKNIPWIVENVVSYYEPLINPSTTMDRHYLWSNVSLPYVPKRPAETMRLSKTGKQIPRMKDLTVSDWEKEHGIKLPESASTCKHMAKKEKSTSIAQLC